MIYLILLAGLVLRLISLNQSLWLDEAISVLAVRSNSLFQIITEYTRSDFHPPGYFILLWVWTHLVNNYSEIWIRTPSVLAGVITIYLTYLIGTKLHSKRLGLVSALLLAFNPLHIYYSQEARMYSVAAVGVLLNWLMFINVVKRERRAAVWYGLTLPLIFLFDYLPYFIFPVHLVVFYNEKVSAKKILRMIWPTAVLIVVWCAVFIPQFLNGLSTASQVSGWRDVVGGADFKTLVLIPIKFIIGRISYSDKFIYGTFILPIIALTGVLLFRSFKAMKNSESLLWYGPITIPIVLSFLTSFYVPVLSYFRLIFLVPFFCLVLGYGIITLKKWWFFLIIMGAIFLSSSLVYLINPDFQREDWRRLVNFTHERVVLIDSNDTFAPLKYYSATGNIAALKVFPATRVDEVIDLKKELERLGNPKQIYYLEYLVDISDPKRLVKTRIEELGFRNTATYNFAGVGFLYEYQR